MKSGIKKHISLFLILTICLFSLSGCYNLYNIDHLAYAVAIGLDVGKNNELKISFQLSVPGNSSDSGRLFYLSCLGHVALRQTLVDHGHDRCRIDSVLSGDRSDSGVQTVSGRNRADPLWRCGYILLSVLAVENIQPVPGEKAD